MGMKRWKSRAGRSVKVLDMETIPIKQERSAAIRDCSFVLRHRYCVYIERIMTVVG